MVEPLKETKANPQVRIDPYMEELFGKIKADNITIDPTVWSLLTHVLGNRTYAMSLILGDFLSLPKWVLNAGSCVMRFLYKMSGHKDKISNIDYVMEKALNNALQIKDFLGRLRQTTEKKAGF